MWLTPFQTSAKSEGVSTLQTAKQEAKIKPFFTMTRKRGLTGWLFLSVASALIILTSFYPFVRAIEMAMYSGAGTRMQFAGLVNFQRLLIDPHLKQVLSNTFLFLLVQVPMMILLGLILAAMLNDPKLKGKGIFRTAIFLPCAVGLVAYSLVFRQMFAVDGIVNTALLTFGILDTPYNFLGTAWSARMVIIIGLMWRWTGYNMMFYLAGLQQIEPSIYEAARIDGANVIQQFRKITLPLLRPMILLTAIMSTTGTLQLFDEPFNLTNGGPGIATRTIAFHVFNVGFQQSPNLGYASAVALLIFVIAAILGLIQIKVGDKRW